MRITYNRDPDDPEAGAAYVYLGEAKSGEAVHQVILDGPLAGIIVDIDAHGRVLGFEFLAVERLLKPEVLAAAEQI
jgi:uncharacterized protein YuzE